MKISSSFVILTLLGSCLLLTLAQKNISENKFIGKYTIISKASAKAIDVKGASKANEASIILYTRNNGNNQKFNFWRTKDNYYFIEASHSNKVLDNPGSSNKAGENIIQYDYNGGTNQQWQLVSDKGKILDFNSKKNDLKPTGKFFFIKNRASGLVLDVFGGNSADGTKIIQYGQKSGSGASNQLWKLIS